jgi:hypothetical protein
METPGMYEVTVECCCGCGVKDNVPQVGALPVGWVGVTWPERAVHIAQPGMGAPPGMPIGPQPGGQPTIEQRTMVFSSWRCVNKHVKAKLTGSDKEASD